MTHLRVYRYHEWSLYFMCGLHCLSVMKVKLRQGSQRFTSALALPASYFPDDLSPLTAGSEGRVWQEAGGTV